jgi:hypothetical protein
VLSLYAFECRHIRRPTSTRGGTTTSFQHLLESVNGTFGLQIQNDNPILSNESRIGVGAHAFAKLAWKILLIHSLAHELHRRGPARRVLKSSARADHLFQGVISDSWFFVYSAVDDFVDAQVFRREMREVPALQVWCSPIGAPALPFLSTT